MDAAASHVSKGIWTAKCWLDAVLGFLYPDVCQYCGDERATVQEGYVGERCQAHVAFIKPPYCDRCGLPFAGQLTTRFECQNCREMDLQFGCARSAVEAKGMVLELIHQYKYGRALWLEPFLGGLLVERARPALAGGGWDMIAPVPLHPAKEREREFNQASRLARRLSRATALPLHAGLLRRIQPTRTQTHLSRADRRANVLGAFRWTGDPAARGRRIVLIDDVLTTGATTDACARELRQAGAADVCVWTLARGLWQ